MTNYTEPKGGPESVCYRIAKAELDARGMSDPMLLRITVSHLLRFMPFWITAADSDAQGRRAAAQVLDCFEPVGGE